jgi:hypothetical protein
MQFYCKNATFIVGMQFYCRKSNVLQEMKYICNNFIFTVVNKILLKNTFFRNALKKPAPYLTGPSSLYTIGGDQVTKSRDQENYLSCYQGLLVRGDSDVFEVLQCQIL